MNLAKWLRKNNTKVMAVVVIFIFVGFVGEAFLTQLSQRRASRPQTIAYFAGNRVITNYDVAAAERELGILKLLQADNILRNTGTVVSRTLDLQAVLLAELLFPDRTVSPSLNNRIKQMIETNRYRISNKQIDDIYNRSMPSEVYWLLLSNEAQLAGMRMSNETVGSQLAKMIPSFFNGATYSQVMRSITDRQGVSEEEILTAFGKLMSVLMYSKAMCIDENITNSQMMYDASKEQETLDVEFVRFESYVFAKTAKEPDEKEIVEQFDRYKGCFAGDVNDQNPYGFGYKLDNMVRLEYIAVKLDDVSTVVKVPTQEDAEEFYQRHKEEFTISIPSDPNDPNSPPTERTKGYSEVAAVISKKLTQDRISSEAERILQEARTLTEAGLQGANMEPAKISNEQFKQLAGDYVAAAQQLSEKYKIKVYTGQTGMLSASDVLKDNYLGVLYLVGGGYNPAALSVVVFAIDELAVSELGPFDAPKPRLYENIGPVKDMLGRIMAVIRVTKAEKASVPESVDITFTKTTLELGEDQKQDEKVYSVRKIVTEDLKRLAAMDTTKNKAEEFIGLAVKSSWGSAVEKFNKLYKQQDEKAGQDANVFELQNLTDLQRTSSLEMETAALRSEGGPMGRSVMVGMETETRLINQLYSLIPQDSNTVDGLPLVIEFKPGMSYYCLKDISVRRIEQGQYDKIKVLQDYKEDFIEFQSLAPVHFNPENILKRMKFHRVKENEPADINTPSEPEEAL
jgi:macrodomain Ter protein organizer (MatP/YcbG family)